MQYIKCRDCGLPALVKPFAKGEGYFLTKNPNGCQCGTDQRRSKPFQKWILKNAKDTVAELGQVEPKPAKTPDKPVVQKPDEATDKTPSKTHSKLWWLLLPVVGLGVVFAKAVGKKQ